MPPEPSSWNRRDLFKERKHDRSDSSSSLGVSFARWRDSHHGSRDFRRPPDAFLVLDFGGFFACFGVYMLVTEGHGKQGAWHMYPEDSPHGFGPNRPGEKILEDENGRSFGFRGDGKYGRSNRDNRGSFGSRDWKNLPRESTSASPSASGRLTDLNYQNPRSVDDIYSTHSHMELENGHGLGMGHRHERDNSFGAIDWKPLKWARTGSLSSRGSGFSHSSSSKSLGVDSVESKVEVQPKSATPVQSPRAEVAASVTSVVAPMEEARARKKPRLGWGEGLAKYEKKKVEGPDETLRKNGLTISASSLEPLPSVISNLLDKSPRVVGFSDCASPATASSVACSSSPGMEDKPFAKAGNVDSELSNLSGSPGPGTQSSIQMLSLNLENRELNMMNLSSLLAELVQSDDPSSADTNFVRSTAMSKLLVLKGEISKKLELTESEIDLLESELKTLKSEACGSSPSGSLLGKERAITCESRDTDSLISGSALLQFNSSGNMLIEKKLVSCGASEEVHIDVKDEDIDSPGSATSKYVEQTSIAKGDLPADMVKDNGCSRDSDRGLELQSWSSCDRERVLGSFICSQDRKMDESNSGAPVSSNVHSQSNVEGEPYEIILASNRELASRAAEVFNNLLLGDQSQLTVVGGTNAQCWQNDNVKQKFIMKQRFLRFKERVIFLKFRAFQHLWKEDIRLLSIRKYRAKCQKKFESSLRIPASQKHRSSIRSRFASPAGSLSLVPTTEIVNYASKLLADSRVRIYRSTLKMPALILDKKEKTSIRFISTNGLVEDPCAVEKERVMINPWTSKEKEIFIDKLSIYGKDFRKIASFLDHKTTADCIEFYYKNHKSDGFEKTKKKPEFGKHVKSLSSYPYLVTSGKKWNREMNAASLDVLGTASVIASHADASRGNRKTSSGRILLGEYSDYKVQHGDDGFLERSSSFDVLGSERETVAADVLAGISGSLSSEAMSSCITSSVDPGEGFQDWKCQNVGSVRWQPLTPEVMQNVDDDTCSDESCGGMDPAHWTVEEKSDFVRAVSSYGKDFTMISRMVRTKSRDQCKAFFSKAKGCLGLDIIRFGPGNRGTPTSDDTNGGGSDTEDACVVETCLADGSNKSGSKTDENLPQSVMKMSNHDSEPVGTINLKTDLNRSEEDSGTEALDADAQSDDLVSSDCPAEGPGGDGNQADGVKIESDANMSAKNESRGGKTLESKPLEGSASVGEAIDNGPSCLSAVVGADDQSEVGNTARVDVFRLDSMPKSYANDKADDKVDRNEGVESDLNSSLSELNAVRVESNATASSSACSVSFTYSNQSKNILEVCSVEPQSISLQPNCCHVGASYLIQDGKSLDKSVVKPHKSAGEGEFVPNSVVHPKLNQVESPIFQGYPLQMSTKKEMNGGNDCKLSAAVLSLPKLERHSQSGQYFTQEPYIQKCNGMKPQGLVTELPLLAQHLEPATEQLRHSHSRSLSDIQTPSRNGDVKLFGQILTNPSSQQKTPSGSQENDKGAHPPKLTSNTLTLKFNGNPNIDPSSEAYQKFDRNNHLGLENVPVRSYGFWDGNRIQTGLSSMPDSAILLAKYPAAFMNYPPPSSKMEQQPLQAVVKTNDGSLNGVSVFPARDLTSINGGLAEYQMYRSQDGTTKVLPFTADVKQGQDIFAEMQRKNGFDSVPGLQQATSIVGNNLVGRGVLINGSCNGISDPVAAIKMHYAKADQFGGQAGGIILENETWRGKTDLGSR
ncbi:SANT/Myb domain [Dillenia turbinata]|uniref:SANT/Myb domain n=1 Tax=Dillenia turbinata TaxID=194707 RepID=A0AAN8ZG56_9MAGN